MESPFVEFNDAFNGLIREMAVVKPTAETQHNGTGLNHRPPSPHDDLMGTPVHLTFFPRGMIDGRPGFPIGSGPDRPYIFLEDGIPAVIAQFLDLFHDPNSGKVLFADEESDLGFIGIQLAGFGLCGGGPGMNPPGEDPSDGLAGDAGLFMGLFYGPGFFKGVQD